MYAEEDINHVTYPLDTADAPDDPLGRGLAPTLEGGDRWM